MKQKHARQAKSTRNPLYIKIGKRIRQARLMAKESNSRALSERLGWSGGRINNFETGASTPGIEETLQLCEVLSVDPCWLTYGVGSPRVASLQNTRYRNLMAVVDDTEQKGELPELLEGIRLTIEQLVKYRANPFKPITDQLARRCERHLQQPKGWLDESHIRDYCVPLPEDMRNLLALYSKLSESDRKKFYAMGELLLSD